MYGVEKAEGWKDAVAGVYGEDGPDPEVLDAGESIPPGPVENIDRRKFDD